MRAWRYLHVAAAVLAVPSSAQNVATPSAWVDSIFSVYNHRGVPGCAVGIVQKDTLTFARGYGEADLRRHTANSPQSAFYVASLSKQFTAMSIVLLVQDGKVRLDDDVRKWVPEVPNLGRITILDLLQHTSGLRDYYTLLGITGWRANELFTEQTLLEMLSRQRALNFKPGEEFLYNNTGYALLAVVVRRASGQTLREFAATRIFKPLGMTHTQYRDDHSSVIDGEAIGYIAQGRGYVVSIPQLDVVGDGGVFTTVVDLARWDANLQSGKVGGKAGVALLQAPGHLNDGSSTGYALGLNIGSFNGERLVSHSGSYGGYQSTYMRFPDERLSVITLCNVATPSATLAEQVASVYMPQMYRVGDGGMGSFPSRFDIVQQNRSVGATPDVAQLEEPDEQVWLEGKYYSEELDMEVVLRSRSSILYMQRPVGDSLAFKRVARDVFTTSDQVTMQVERDGAGVVAGFLLSTGRVRGLRFAKRSGIFGQFGADEFRH
jgi:CubicO group peptidase (beta-lactamase class C family)